MKRFRRVFFSMKFALLLLGILIVACIAGSILPQGELASYYMSAYPQNIAGAILALGLDDVFHCLWFVVLTIILCLNLIGCNIIHFPALLRRTRSGFTLENYQASGSSGKRAPLFTSHDPETLFHKCGFKRLVKGQTGDGRAAVYGVKNRAGIWGAWLCHLGMLIVIAGFALGQIKQVKYAVYGVPGQTKRVEDTPYEMTIDDFTIGLRDDDTVEQYTASITLRDTRSGEEASGQTSVNHPCTLLGMRCYQNSTGWAATVQIYQGEELIQENVLCAGEYVNVEGKEDLAVMLSAFYPDYVESENGTPMTASSRMNHPAYLYRLYYQNEILGMNVLEEKEVITVDDYTILFTEPRSYTLIQLKKDPFTHLALIGAAIMCIALILAFYLRTAEVYAVCQPDGDWVVSGYSRKGGSEFVERLKQQHEELEGGIVSNEQ